MTEILLIEDDVTFRRAMRLSLEKAGYSIAEANDGQAGLQAFQARSPGLLIIDLIMPEKEGVETICAIRQINKRVPIIAISGGGRGNPADYLRMAAAFGANEVLAKPIQLDSLLSVVDRLLGRPVQP